MSMDSTFDYNQSPSYATNSYQDNLYLPESYPDISTTKTNNKRRSQVKNACVNCQKACKKCDEGRPCQRCIKLGITDTCINSPRKERKKGFKRGPYKKKNPSLNQQTAPKKVLKTQKTPGLSPMNRPKARTASNASSLSYSPSLADWPLDCSPSFPSLSMSQAMPSDYHTQTPPDRNTINLAEQSFYDFYNHNYDSTNYQCKPQEPVIKECYDPCVPVIDYSSLTIQQDFLLSVSQPNDLFYHQDYKPMITPQLVPKLENYNPGGITSTTFDAMLNQTEFTDNYSNSKYCQHENNFLYNQWPKEPILLDQQNIYATYGNQLF